MMAPPQDDVGSSAPTPTPKYHQYGAVPTSSHDADLEDATTAALTEKPKLNKTYNLSFAFSLMSGTVWCSMSMWGAWIAIFYGKAAIIDWNLFNTVDYDLYTPDHPWASLAICVHLMGAAYMALAGAFQLVKYIRVQYPAWHRWVGRFYILACFIACTGALFFIVTKGGYGGRAADRAFGVYGILFLYSGLATYYYAAVAKDYTTHKLWAWRLYALSLSGWIYRFDYYWWMVFFGIGQTSWLHDNAFQGFIDLVLNWAFFVPSLIVVEIVFRWGENRALPTVWARVLNVCYYIIFVMTVIFTIHGLIQLRIPSIMGTYESGWIM